MAELFLDRNSRYGLELPDVCMKCGAPATVRKSKTFAWFPPWVYILILCHLLVFAIVAVIMTKRRTLDVPLCEEHKNHWLKRQFLVYGSLLALVGGGVATLIVMPEFQGPRGGDDLTGFVCMGWVGLLIVWIIGAVIAQAASIRAREITDSTITLQGVSAEFVRACEEERRGLQVPLDELAAERWNQKYRRPRVEERPGDEDTDRIQRADDREGRDSPDTYQEGTP